MRKSHLVLIGLLSFILLPALSLAASGVYFEYAPDPWRSTRLAVAGNETPFQYFQSASDFTLDGVDFWLDNLGDSGTATFTLLDDQKAELTSQTVTIPSLGAAPGGHKFHIDFPKSVPISHYRTYSIQIASTLLNPGLYYANRIDILEHNLQYTTEYALGAAYLGNTIQNFTFKFALHDPSITLTEPTTQTPPITPVIQTPTETIITNARIINITDTTAIAAWTTNVAADSRVTIRTQLNYLYVYTTAYDPTLELEHALLITGLNPLVPYYADFFSQQTADEPILTTYSVSFKTLAATTQGQPPPAQNQITAPPANQQTTNNQQNTQTNNQQTTNQNTQNNASQTNNTQTNSQNSTTTQGATGQGALWETTAPPTFGEGNGLNSFSIAWQTPTGGVPNGGYRIDIFDSDHRLVRQLRSPASSTTRNVAALPAGDYNTIVYADRDGLYTKVAAPAPFQVEKEKSPLFWFWYLMGVVLSVGIVLAFLFSRREKIELPKLE